MEIEAFEMRSLKVGITTKTLEKRYREAHKVIYKRVTLFEVDALVLENRIKLYFADKKDSRIKLQVCETESDGLATQSYFY